MAYLNEDGAAWLLQRMNDKIDETVSIYYENNRVGIVEALNIIADAAGADVWFEDEYVQTSV